MHTVNLSMIAVYTINRLINLISMLLVSRSGLLEEDAVEVFHHYDFHLSSSFLCKILSYFR